MEKENQTPEANNQEGEDNSQVAEPTTETTTETPEEEVREDSNPSNGKPENVPYDTFAEERRKNREYKEKLSEYERVIGSMATPKEEPTQTGTPPQPSEDGRVPDEFILDDGTVDINRYTNWIKSSIPDPQKISEAVVERINRENTLKEMNRKEESALYEKYPDVKGDTERRNLVEAIRNQSLLEGKYMSRVEAAEKLFGMTSKASADTRKQMQETREIQANSSAPPTPAKVDGNTAAAAQLKERLESQDPSVREKARLELLRSGLGE